MRACEGECEGVCVCGRVGVKVCVCVGVKVSLLVCGFDAEFDDIDVRACTTVGEGVSGGRGLG